MKRNYLFAMTAPGSIKLDQDILGFVHDDIVESFSDHYLHGFIVALGDRLASVEWLQLSFREVFVEFHQGLGTKGSLVVVFLHFTSLTNRVDDFELYINSIKD